MCDSKRVRLLAALLVTVLWCPAVLADPAAQARFHDGLARTHYEAARYEAALREFFLAQRIAPNSRIAFNIALCFEGLERSEDAFQYFTEYLEGQDDDAERRGYATKAAEKLGAKVARVLVKSTPPGGSVFVDQKEHGRYGQTPRLIAVTPGKHRLWIELEGHKGASREVQVGKGEQIEVALDLVPIVGQVSVVSAVAGFAVVRSPEGQQLAEGSTPLSAALPPGIYEVTVHADAHLPWTGVVAIEADTNKEVVAAPRPAPAATGDVTVTANVPGAIVELDGQPAGFAPVVLSDVPTGGRVMKIRSPGLLSWEGTVEIGSDERSWVTVALEEPPSVRRSPSTWVVGGLGVAALGAAGVFGILANDAHSDFEAADPASDRSDLRERGIKLNVTADTLMVTGLVALGAATVLYFTTGEVMGRDSSASVSRAPR